MRPNAASFILVLAIAWPGLVACTVLEPKADLTRFYVLRASPPALEGSETPNRTLPELRVGPGRLAAYLDATPVAVLDGPHQLRYLENHHWAEALSRGVGRTLSEALVHKLDAPHITSYPDPLPGASGYDVRYNINRFEGRLDGTVTLEVAWQLFQAPSATVIFSAHSTYEIPVEGPGRDVAAYVNRMSSAIDRWADDIASAVNSVAKDP